MNIFNLFNSNDTNSIKLGIEVVKTLGYQYRFELCFDVGFEEYERVFNEIIIPLSKQPYTEYLIRNLLNNNLDLSTLKINDVILILINIPEQIEYLDISNISDTFLKNELLKIHPQLKPYFDK